ncbi:hypothetical protein C4D60_Mb11t11860 [Musa balbisiana]|uniref:Uncharacterized protein n=1 Tax=Musa balbisiana TaxID=52838 RepID=A0A4S8J5X5_MUSBA|nr:hypothetical protein C4D60_Mb11t11860 [Musa balbisiana]
MSEKSIRSRGVARVVTSCLFREISMGIFSRVQGSIDEGESLTRNGRHDSKTLVKREVFRVVWHGGDIFHRFSPSSSKRKNQQGRGGWLLFFELQRLRREQTPWRLGWRNKWALPDVYFSWSDCGGGGSLEEMASKFCVITVGLLVISLVMLVRSTETPAKENGEGCIPIGAPCKTASDCNVPCGRDHGYFCDFQESIEHQI